MLDRALGGDTDLPGAAHFAQCQTLEPDQPVAQYAIVLGRGVGVGGVRRRIFEVAPAGEVLGAQAVDELRRGVPALVAAGEDQAPEPRPRA
ncbi:MAG: hypothetical protein QOG59_1933 [Solirubrobacteraceae bacterium]|nr:hypothetical protein [Solirubrobacteraceae bacterium]